MRQRAVYDWLLSAILALTASTIGLAQAAPSQPAPAAKQPPASEKAADSVKPSPSEPPQKTAWELLRTTSNDRNALKRQNAVLALATLGPSPRAVRIVQSALLNDKEVNNRQTAASALAEMKARSALPALRKALDDKSAVVRFAAAKSLWDLGDHTGRDVLIEVLQGESSPSEGFIKSSFAEADRKLHNPHELALMGINEASGAFLGPFSMGVVLAERMAKDNTAGARALSATLLATDHDPRSVRDLDHALLDKNWTVRQAAARALGNYSCKALIADLQPLLEDKKDEVKLMAAASILRIAAAHPPAIPSECTMLVPGMAANRPVRAADESASHPAQAPR